MNGLLERVKEESATVPGVLIVELTGLPEGSGVTAVRNFRASEGRRPVVAVSRADSPVVTQQAVRLSIDDYFRLPEDSEDFVAAVQALLKGSEAPAKACIQQNVLVGTSKEIETLRRYISRVTMTDSSVLITGETGTGKELVAEMIHKGGPRRNKPLICVNSAALPDSLLESELFGYEKGAFTGAVGRYPGKLRIAHGGTIFFDEIAELSLSAQAKILRAIESREVHPLGGWGGVSVDVRVITATNRDVDAMTQRGEFRQDLFYRLNVVRIELPPLRNRKEDIPHLLGHFVGVYNRQLNRRVEGFRDDAVMLLESYGWPGNIRELKNVVEASFVNAMSDRIGVIDLPERLRRALEDKAGPNSREKLIRVLLATNWNISKVADELRCSRMTVYRKMAQHNVSRSCERSSGFTAEA